jgi:phosphohistidine phosphatase
MLELMLLRHAKAKRPEGVEDFDRRLSGRGREEATALGKIMLKERLVPELVLLSSSRRTTQTWERIAAELPTDVPVRPLRSLYLAGPAKILEQVKKSADGMQRVLVVGHNPGIGALASRLAGEQLQFPTCAMAVIAFDAARWADVERGRLAHYFS